MNVRLPEFSDSTRTTLEKYLPLLIAVGIAWLCARGIRKMFWTAFGLYMAFHAIR